VEKTNPAVHLYEGRGFKTAREDDGATVMVADLA